MSGVHIKKFMGIILAVCVLLCALTSTAVEETAAPANMDGAKGAILVEANSQQILMELAADAAMPVAGLSKLPALLVLCEAADNGTLDLNAEVSVSRRAAGIGGPSAFIEAGEAINAGLLMKAAVMILAGDAIAALGETAFGTETAFMDCITSRMSELGLMLAMEDSVGKGALFTPRMLASIGAALMRSTCFKAHSKLTYEVFTHADGRETELASANRMLRDYAGCGGVATGSSPTDGYCGVFAVTRGDTELICVVLGAKNSSTRFAAAQGMLDETFASVRAQKLAAKGDVLAERIRVHGGKNRDVNLVAKDTVVLLLNRADPALMPVKDIPDYISAPTGVTDVVGSISYQDANGMEVGKVELVPQTAVVQSVFRDCIREVLLTFLRL